MAHDPDKAAVQDRIRAIGYDVEDLEASAGDEDELADLRATRRPEPALIVEVKSREEDQGFLAALAGASPGRLVAKAPRQAGYAPTISDAISHAVDQIESSRRSPDELGCLWLYVTDQRMETTATDQLEATLLGRRLALAHAPPAPAAFKHVYFATWTRFYEHPTLDLAISQERIPKYGIGPNGELGVAGEAQRDLLLVNPFGKRIDEVQRTSLFQAYLAQGAVGRLPEDEEREGTAFMVDVDGEVDRRDDAAVLRYLQQKYESAGIRSLADLTEFAIGTNVHTNPREVEGEA